ncbi:DNA polymerase III subunit beta [Lyticum sinuosum]|uniref:Beta sliding clamp n=1 Tax=Lyticum sinuosum TaxID=1332059 RepID=A0AAE4VKT8_9RICK|nr:DNA polymerase III subunit beta [Lyticum sinuosum]MDZ5761273.1 DNA polymerase III subunit beta [Lyticum sinuosum]
MSIIIVSRKELAKALSRIVTIIEKKSNISILKHVKIDIENNSISLTVTDSDVIASVNFAIDYLSNEKISFTTIAHNLHDISRKMSCDNISLEINIAEKNLLITSDINRFSLPCLGSSSFPNFNSIDDAFSFSLNVSDLKHLIYHTKHAMSYGDNRYYLSGLHIHTDDDKLTAVATDVHRMALTKINKPLDLYNNVSIIIPRKTVSEIYRIIGDYSDNDIIITSISEKKIHLSLKDFNLSSKLIESKFPNYKSIFSKENQINIRVEATQLIKAVDLVTAISESKIKSVRILFKKDNLVLSVDNQIGHKSYGSHYIDSSTENFNEDIEIIVNSRYLIDILSVIIGKYVKISISNAINPIIFCDDNDNRAIYILMPMQFGE